MVKPLHKKDNKANVENYRPITLLSLISKVYEKCIFDPLYEHVANLIPTTQFGFQKKKSTITQLLVYLGEIYSNVDISEQVVDAVYLDFSKAFDKIDHNILLSKLSKIGVRGNMLKVLQSYLKNRQQFVDIEGRASEYLSVSSGVPQGSILGPLLFLIYLIDLSNDLSSEVFSFADDFKLLSLHKHNEPCDLQFDLDRLWNWCTSHQMSFNIDKCCVMHFKTKNCGPFYLGCNELKTSSCEKDLGVKVSSSLKWSEHIKFASAKAIKVLFLLKRSSAKQLQASTKVNLYKSMVLPIICYGSSVWYSSKTDLTKLENIQKKAANWATNYSENCYTDKLSTLNLLPLSLYIELNDILTLSKVINNRFDFNWHPFVNFSSRRNNLFDLPYVSKEQLKGNFWYRTQRLANLLNNRIDFLNSNGLKARLLKTYWCYFNDVYNSSSSCTWRVLCLCANCRQTNF